MSEQARAPIRKRRWIVLMRPRSPHEAHRAATPLELFFDLVFAVAVAQVARRLHHHGLAKAQVVQAVLSYAMVFFAIWRAWINFTWFVSAYDTDDTAYRLAVFMPLTGALILRPASPLPSTTVILTLSPPGTS